MNQGELENNSNNHNNNKNSSSNSVPFGDWGGDPRIFLEDRYLAIIIKIKNYYYYYYKNKKEK